MIFSSIEFIFIFLPIFLVCFYILPEKYRKYVVLIGSIIFYLIGTWKYPQYLLLLLSTVFINFKIGQLLEKKQSKLLLIFGILYNFNWLIFFKYSNAFVDIFNNLNNSKIDMLNLALPIGISFYTFELTSYLIDIYRKKYSSEKSIIDFSTNILMFPKLTSGPISTYPFIKKEIDKNKYKSQNLITGIKYFVLGLSFKVLLADKIGTLWNELKMIGFESISTNLAWIGILAYTLQLYFDFSGYSFMAIGVGKMIGVDLPENFKTPYLAKSMSDFFRRWHITLGTWFKNYIYIPLGGNKKGILRTIFNLGIVWLITGLWHGSSFNFVLWGVFVFLIIALEKTILLKFLDKHPIISHLYMWFLIPIMWAIFAITDFSELQIFLGKLFSFDKGLYALDYIKYLKLYGTLLVIGIICCTKLPEKIVLSKKTNVFQLIIILSLFWGSIYYLYQGLNNPFLYFGF